MIPQSGQTSLVVIHSEVIEVTLDASSERLMLHRHEILSNVVYEIFPGASPVTFF